MNRITEDAIEHTTLEWLEKLGYGIAHGPDIAFDGLSPERSEEANYTDVVLIRFIRCLAAMTHKQHRLGT